MDRQQWRPPIGEVAFGAFRLVPQERALYRHGEPVRLSGRAFDLLVALVERAGTVVGKDELIACVWPRTVVEEGNLRVHIGALRKALGTDQPYVENVVGRGYSFVAPLHAPPAQAIVPYGSLIPAQPRLVGRAPVLEQLARELAGTRLLTIAGPGGMGKTSVAQALVARAAPQFGRHVYVADLAPLAEPALLPGVVARAFGLAAPQSAEALADALADALVNSLPHTLPHTLHRRRVLLVLDGCEHLIDAARQLAGALLGRLPALHILATSREPLRADGEHVFRLPPLAVPVPAEAADLAALATCPSVQLFVERASADGGFTLDADNAAAVAEICRRLDGIPLALELAAGRAAFFGVHELARRLSDRFAVLTRGRRTALPRHQTLRAALDWSHALLAPAEQAVLRRLAIFRGTFTLEGAAALAGCGGIGAQAVAGHAAQLVAKSMLTADTDGRYRLLDTTRAYALEQLRAAGEEHAVAERHLRYCCTLLARAEHDVDALDAVLREVRLDDVRAALDWAFGPGGAPLLGARLAAVSAPLWYRHSMMEDYRARLGPALACAAAAGSAGAPLAAALYLALGHTLLHAGDMAAPRADAFGRALALAERLGDHGTAVRALWGCYADALLQGDYGRALGLAWRFGPLARASGMDGDGRVQQRLLARARHYLGDQHAARAHAEAVVHPARRAPGAAGFQFDQRVSSLAIHGRVLWLQGLPEQAVQAAREGVDEALRLDHSVSLCFALVLAIPVALWSGDLPMARHCIALMAERAARDRLAHWSFWARAFQAALQRHDAAGTKGIGLEPADALLRHPSCTGLHLDMLPTLHVDLMTPASLARAVDGRAGWAAPELLRCWGEQLVRVGATGQAGRVFRLALALAHRQGALAWELRAATSLARLLACRHRDGGGLPRGAHESEHGGEDGSEIGSENGVAAVLAPLLARYREGHASRDVLTAQACLEHCSA
ncbi:ATP-binding protein [Pseudoduganella umbonata]|uniref:Putative ATPase/DNA-binding winged helix-turn-helix (WHTH) protein n=1 Tax=Pseudoduganella umbonata TaxID=864828 RepID=A0A4P8HMJ2_9BURK|nr:winged helix-turn-helix domain-containing protein [Pseudoduganella umbonata]MBB3222546.1 putative ATPase/DNA-binding winged helix-turn-helix (wHTH) protein [Pseudoduganella umbonata]QCP10927.1 transcriptional regulator [Pseudoduganella umbonata]